MEPSYDYRKFAILYVDDEEKSLKYFRKTFEPQFRILTAPNAGDAFRILQENAEGIGLLMTDQRMPGEQGVQLLEKTRRLCPRILRVLVTAYSDIGAAIESVNAGAIYKYVEKPWKIPELELTLRRGLEFFMVQLERDRLLSEKLAMMQNLIVADRLVSLGALASGLNHHLRNSLVAIRTFLDLAPSKLNEENVDVERAKDPKFWTEFHAHVQTQVARITEMLTELGGTAQRSNLALREHVSVGEVITGAAAALEKEMARKGITVEFDLPASLPLLRADQWKLQRLFELLLANELPALPEGSRISFRARGAPNGHDRSWALEVEIHDESPGLPIDALRSMFDPFVAHARQGADYGIQLMTCYFIVYHHGGTIEARNDERGGVTFRLRFPLEAGCVSQINDDQSFLAKVLWNESLREKFLAGG